MGFLLISPGFTTPTKKIQNSEKDNNEVLSQRTRQRYILDSVWSGSERALRSDTIKIKSAIDKFVPDRQTDIVTPLAPDEAKKVRC